MSAALVSQVKGEKIVIEAANEGGNYDNARRIKRRRRIQPWAHSSNASGARWKH